MPNRQIAIDTETTGLIPEEGHRIIEIGGIELVDRRYTGNDFHVYINPDRAVDRGALAVHGISSEFLSDKPRFSEICDQFLSYIKGAELIIHNAPFDVGFLNHEMHLCRKGASLSKYANIFDTLTLARKKHPGQRNSLDALCKRYHVDNSKRNLHGALLDAGLLAEVYLAMTGGQISMFGDLDLSEGSCEGDDSDGGEGRAGSRFAMQTQTVKQTCTLKILRANEEELAEHEEFLNKMQKHNGGKRLWDSDK